MQRFDPQSAFQQVVGIAQAVGVSDRDAIILADALVDADLQGTSTHGITRLNIYVQRIKKGLIDPRAEIAVDSRRPAVLVVDANNGLGQVQAVKTMDRLVPLAREYGVASATIRRSQHFGALSYYSNRAAAHDAVLLAMTTCEPAMSPTGGRDAFFGTNPIAVSFPTGIGYPIRIDLATSIAARGNIVAADKAGRPIPEGWALDVDGNPTTDAAKALMGTVLTMAGHKGYALAVMVEVLSSVLSGSAIGPAIGSMYKDLDRPQDVGHFFCVLDIGAFMEPVQFRSRIDMMIDQIKTCETGSGVEEILVPGERSHRTRQQNQGIGIPIDRQTCRELRSLCDEHDVPFVLRSFA